MHNSLGASQHPVRHGIHPADHALGEFIGKGISVKIQRLQTIIEAIAEQLGTLSILVLLKKIREAFPNAFLLWNATKVRDIDTAPRLLDTETEQRAECFPGGGTYPVWIAAPGVQHLGIALPFSVSAARK